MSNVVSVTVIWIANEPAGFNVFSPNKHYQHDVEKMIKRINRDDFHNSAHYLNYIQEKVGKYCDKKFIIFTGVSNK
jgi:hypothetical protein